MTDSATNVRLERRPEARSFSIEDLLEEIRSGRLRVPRFQRTLNWTDQDRLALFDSIYRGFPIGTLLLWRSPAEAGRVGMGRFIVDAEARSDALWVVDGQQRMLSLAEVLLIDPDSARGERTVRFDLEGESGFAYGSEATKSSPHWIPLYVVPDSARLLAWAQENQLGGRALSTALDLGERIREYQIPAYVVEATDEGVPRQIFDRLNSSGKALKASEVFDALHGAQAPGEPASLREVARGLEELGFGHIEEELVLRALLAVRRKDPGRSFRQIKVGDVPEALAETASALRQAITFVKKVAEFPHIELLPYKLPLAALALFFHEHREPSARTRLLLTRWLWRGAISGAHSGSTSALRQTLGAIVPKDEEQAVQNLLDEAGERPQEAPVLQPFNFRHARTKLQLLALAALRPRHLVTGEEFDVADLCEQRDGPAIRLSSMNRTPEGRGLANRILHSATLQSRDLRLLLAMTQDSKVLASQMVSAEAREALRRGAFDLFLRLREEGLRQHVASFLSTKAEWDPSDRDRPSLASLVVSE